MGIHPGFETQGRPEIQNSGISGPTKRPISSKISFKKHQPCEIITNARLTDRKLKCVTVFDQYVLLGCDSAC